MGRIKKVAGSGIVQINTFRQKVSVTAETQQLNLRPPRAGERLLCSPAPDLPALGPWSKIRLHWRVPGCIALAQEVRLCQGPPA